MYIVLLIILIEILVILMLIGYNIYIKKNLEIVENSKENFSKLMILKKLLDVIAEETDVNSKIYKVNELFINHLNTTYSSIIYFDGIDYKLKATNVHEDAVKDILSLHNNEIFKECIEKNELKYITIEGTETLSYLTEGKNRVKSTMFIPLLKNNMLLGYWLLEDKESSAYNKIDTEILITMKESLLDIIGTLSYEKSLETMVRDDEFSKLKSVEYLLTEGRRRLNKYKQSAVIMFKLTNLVDINNSLSREAGNTTITEVTNKIQQLNLKNIQFVRYFGPKFIIVFEGKNPNEIQEEINLIQSLIKNMDIVVLKDGRITTKEKYEIEKNIILNSDLVKEETKQSNESIYDIDDLDDIDNIQEEKQAYKEFKSEIAEIEKEKNIEAVILTKTYYRDTDLDIICKTLENEIDIY